MYFWTSTPTASRGQGSGGGGGGGFENSLFHSFSWHVGVSNADLSILTTHKWGKLRSTHEKRKKKIGSPGRVNLPRAVMWSSAPSSVRKNCHSPMGVGLGVWMGEGAVGSGVPT